MASFANACGPKKMNIGYVCISQLLQGNDMMLDGHELTTGSTRMTPETCPDIVLGVNMEVHAIVGAMKRIRSIAVRPFHFSMGSGMATSEHWI